MFIDAAALPALGDQVLPRATHAWVITDGPPAGAVWAGAVDLRADRVADLALTKTAVAAAVSAVGCARA